jgi:hypothetical protein
MMADDWTKRLYKVADYYGMTGWGHATMIEAAATIAALAAKLAAAEKDAARYRWLRDSSVGQWTHPIVVTQERHAQGMRYLGPVIGKTLDAAIDSALDAAFYAAIAQGKETG